MECILDRLLQPFKSHPHNYDGNHAISFKTTSNFVQAASVRPETITVFIMSRPFWYILVCILSSHQIVKSVRRVLKRNDVIAVTDAIPMPTGLTTGVKPMTVVKGRNLFSNRKFRRQVNW
jgi:hypothetical protein